MNIFFLYNRHFLTKDLKFTKTHSTIYDEIIPEVTKEENNFYFIDENDTEKFSIKNSEGKYISLGKFYKKYNLYSLKLSKNSKLLFNVAKKSSDFGTKHKFFLCYINKVPYYLSCAGEEFLTLNKFDRHFSRGDFLLIEDKIEDENDEEEEINNTNYIGIIDSMPYVTPMINLQEILNSKMLYSNVDRLKHGIYPESAFGDANQFRHHLCDSKINFIENPDLKRRCHDAIGITLGVLAYGNTEVGRFSEEVGTFSRCCLYLSSNFLKHHYYHVNTIDNLGFFIYNNTIIGGEKDKKYISFNDNNIKDMTPDIYFETYEEMEILVKDSIPLEYLTHIKFSDERDYDYFKPQLDELGITSDY